MVLKTKTDYLKNFFRKPNENPAESKRLKNKK